ncbi:hypothetical protein CKY39_08865 [Variovorax boronicumulans]|uniref:Uncharacterized protein n=2 Tax=Variovorax boronicumulans TaxID=436515 RepID=A0A250DG09_9BURK|nr:hypothetical protein CKY39_08865 [Variovorax boronicumulans]
MSECALAEVAMTIVPRTGYRPGYQRVGLMLVLRTMFLVWLLSNCGLASAQAAWPVLHSMRSVSFTQALVVQCNGTAPSEADARLSAFRAWKMRNVGQASALREFNFKRVHGDAPALTPAEMEVELDNLQVAALATASKDAALCRNLRQWLDSTESEPRHQVPDFMQPPGFLTTQ